MGKTAHEVALKDISEYLTDQKVRSRNKYGDVWIITPYRMFNKETRRLNDELNINKINYYGNTNGSWQRKKQ